MANEVETQKEEVNVRLAELDVAIAAALTALNRLRALHVKKALTPEDFMLFYRGQKLK